MFHHFYKNKSQVFGDGALNNSDLFSLIASIKKKFKILDPEEYFQELKKGKKNIICLTFDDNLLSQYQISLETLNYFNIKAFWFIYSSVFQKKRDYFEIYRRFRKQHYSNFNSFYKHFLEFAKISKNKLQDIKNSSFFYRIQNNYNFYSEKEIIFRIIRDKILDRDEYKKLMLKLISSKNLSYEDLSKNLWMNNSHLKKLSKLGHEIGLHGYYHDRILSSLNYKDQLKSFRDNYNHIKKTIGKKPMSASYPSNSFNSETINILRDLNIKIVFCSNFKTKKILGEDNNFFIPRREPFDPIYK